MKIKWRISGVLTGMVFFMAACSTDSGFVADNGTTGSDTTDVQAVDNGTGTDLPGEAGDGIDATTEKPGIVRFIHISDIHVHGAPDAPNATHVKKAVAKLNKLDFPADFVIATGDYVDYLPDNMDPKTHGTLQEAVDVLNGLKWPWYKVVGNHEYYRDESLQMTTDKAARDKYLSDVLEIPLDYDFTIHGVRFVVLNSMAGDKWETSAGLLGSFTDKQMTWLRSLLADKRPTILFFHQPPTEDTFTKSGDSLCKVIADNPNVVKGIFGGHLHVFVKGHACGVPYYLVGNVDPSKKFYFKVEYDGVRDQLTVLNEDDVPFVKVPEFECDPSAGTIEHPDAAVNTNQAVRAGNMTSNLAGLGQIDGEGLSKLPPVLHIDSWDAGAKTFRARLTFGMNDSGYTKYFDSAPCKQFDMVVDGSCMKSGSMEMTLDIMPLLASFMKVTLNAAWKVRIQVKSLYIEGDMKETDGVPLIDKGLLHLTASGLQALDDIRDIVVTEYCGKRIDGCEPGSSQDMPACDNTADAAFFDEVPVKCDVKISGYSMRFLLKVLSSYSLDNVQLTGEIWTELLTESAEKKEGNMDPALFDTSAGMNCVAE